MEFLTNEKLTIVGAAGMIGSNMAQTAMMMKLTPNICLYDPFAPALEGVAEELYHCGFEGVNLTYTSDIKEALTGASYIVSSGGAARKAGMTREDLLKGNAEIAAQFGKDVRQYCPNVKHIVVIFNPADITGLITLLYSGLKPSQVSTLAALDSTRLQNELVKYFHIPASDIQNCRTYGGHGEQMAVFASTTKIKGEPLTDFIGTTRLPLTEWEALKVRVIQGGKHIIDGQPFRWPAGTYVSNGKFDHIMMAMETSITKDGVTYKEIAGTPAEQEELEKSYEHLCKLRDEVIEMGIIPAIKDWHALNPNID